MSKSYKQTLNMPKTSFPMKANLVQNEPASMKRWDKEKLYDKLRQREHPKGPFVFHDGPPYANGSIHLGHLLNKVLKDFVVRTRSMMGYDTPYIPGWDCHGLPIEHKVMSEQRDKLESKGGDDPNEQKMAIRRACKKYAEKFVKLQSTQMQRLLTLADYDDPYLTMLPRFEAKVLEVFAGLVERGLVYRGLKPVHWSIENQTALADAELEYYEREDTSVFVLFEVAEASKLPASLNALSGKPHYLMIWTTTPWTLPANMAVAVSEAAEYGLYPIGDDKYAVIACDLAPTVLEHGGVGNAEPLGTCRGGDLLEVTCQHPFVDRTGPVVTADYVTLEDGTGMVHTAPGHGVEDYQTGLREGLDIYCPVLGDGTFDETAPQWLAGKTVWEANDLVVEHLRESGHLFHDHKFIHSYPHDWRGKSPTIFRATEQWFVSVDHEFTVDGDGGTLRDRAMSAADSTIRFVPAWGRNRMRGMLESRPDWCLSRQRAWGLPIPAFYAEGEKDPLLTKASVLAIAAVLGEHGSDAWFKAPPEDLLAKYDPSDDPDAPTWAKSGFDAASLAKSSDIFDVWFESGSSWNACMRRRGLAKPDDADAVTDLYLEGSDQHRGWFQLSLLPCLGVLGKPPFSTVLTHGFMVDRDGRKMSKSGGNALDVDELLKDFGADVCRWWVASLNFENDIKVDVQFFKDAGESYRKVRNTLRFLLSNVGDFDPANDAVEFTADDATSPDAWVLGELGKLIDTVNQAYDQYAFRRAYEAMFNFCNETLSAIYGNAMKDRLYCDAADSRRRRRAQTAMHTITDALIRLLAPILPHSADEAWRVLHGEEADSVHLQLLPAPPAIDLSPHWPALMAMRETWMRTLESARQTRDIDNSLDTGLRVPPDDDGILARFDPVDLADLCTVSRFAVDESVSGVVVDDLRDQPRCERSRKRDATVTERSDGAMLSDRDAEVLGV